MRWMWIDAIVELVPRERLVAIKNVSIGEEQLQAHFAAEPTRDLPALPIMPASLMIEGMAQTAGILVGHAESFREKVILAKVQSASIDEDVVPGQTIRYTATIDRFGAAGASTKGLVDLIDHSRGDERRIGAVDLMFSHIDRNMGGEQFPDHNFVFGESFKLLLQMSGIDVPK